MTTDADHIFCLGRVRGFSHEVWLYGWRVAEAHWKADYYRLIGSHRDPSR